MNNNVIDKETLIDIVNHIKCSNNTLLGKIAIELKCYPNFVFDKKRCDLSSFVYSNSDPQIIDFNKHNVKTDRKIKKYLKKKNILSQKYICNMASLKDTYVMSIKDTILECSELKYFRKKTFMIRTTVENRIYILELIINCDDNDLPYIVNYDNIYDFEIELFKTTELTYNIVTTNNNRYSYYSTSINFNDAIDTEKFSNIINEINNKINKMENS